MEDNRRITPRDYLELALRPVQGGGRDVSAKNEVIIFFILPWSRMCQIISLYCKFVICIFGSELYLLHHLKNLIYFSIYVLSCLLVKLIDLDSRVHPSSFSRQRMLHSCTTSKQ